MTSRLDEIAVDIKSAKHEINELRNSVQYSQVELDRVVNQIQNIEKMQSNIAKNATDIAMLQDENVQLKQELERQEAYSRRESAGWKSQKTKTWNLSHSSSSSNH